MNKLILILLLITVPILSCSKSPQDYIDKGYESIVEGDYQGAVRNFTAAIEIDPNNIEAHINRGTSLGILGDQIKAIQDFNRVLELDPQNTEAYMYRGVAKLYLNNKIAGCSDLRLANKLGSIDAKFLINENCIE